MAFSGDTLRLKGLTAFIRNAPQIRAPLSKRLAGTALALVQKGFRDQVDPKGRPWKQLAPSTIKGRRKGKRSGAPQILADTARLKNSITAPSDADGFRIGTNVRYAVYHQQPDGPGKGIIPRRQFLPEGGDYQKPLKADAIAFLKTIGARRAV